MVHPNTPSQGWMPSRRHLIASAGAAGLVLGLATLVRRRPVVIGPRWNVTRSALVAVPLGETGVIDAPLPLPATPVANGAVADTARPNR